MERRFQIYGNPGTLARPDPDWYREHIVTVSLPWPMRNAYNDQAKPVTRVLFHRAGADNLTAALTAIYQRAEELVRLDPAWQKARQNLKHEHGWDRESAYYDALMADDTRALTLALIRSFGGHLFGGTYVHRLVRGGRSLSNHALGIAIDIHPNRNPMGTPLRTTFPSWYIQCWENHGFVWGGRWPNRPDPMHMELRY
jgi:hypothetical protein